MISCHVFCLSGSQFRFLRFFWSLWMCVYISFLSFVVARWYDDRCGGVICFCNETVLVGMVCVVMWYSAMYIKCGGLFAL